MYLALHFRNRLPGVVRNELDQLVAAINAMWDVQHTKDGGLKADSVTTGMLAFTAAESDSIVATINASTEGLLINASLIQINGAVTFASGYDPTGKIAAGGAAADVNANSTIISGGKITVNGSSTFGSGYDPTGKVAAGGSAADVNANSTTIDGGKITTNSVTAAQLLTDLAIANTIRSSGATALSTGTGFWLDATSTPTFRVGNPSADYLKWDGTNLSLVSTNLTINSSGIVLTPPASAWDSARSYRFSVHDSGGYAGLWAADSSGGDARSVILESVYAGSSATFTNSVILRAMDDSGNPEASITLSGIGAGGGSTVETVSIVGTTTVTGNLTTSAGGGDNGNITCGGNFVVSAGTATLNGALELVDGMSAPSTVAGYASIYVDTADGDLKVKFGDGTVKTLATDS